MSYPRYPAYKDSGVEWLDEIPTHWDKKRINWLFKRHKVTNRPQAELLSVYRDSGVIRKSDRDDNFNKPSDDLSTYQFVEQGDLVLNKMKTWQGSIAISNYEGIVSPAYYIAKPTGMSFDRQFVHYLLRSPKYIGQYLKFSDGIRPNQWDLSFDNFKLIEVLLPSLPEQRAIAAFLDRETARIDALVAKQETLIALLHEKRKALISHAVTKGLDRDAPMKDSGVAWLGEVPAHWRVTKLARITTAIGDGLHGTPEYVDESPYYFINGNNLSNGVIRVTSSTRCVSEEEFKKHKIELDNTSLLMSINGTIGNVAYYGDELIMLGKSAAYINCAQDLSRNFLFFLLQSSAVEDFFGREVTGTTIFNLSLASIRNLPVALPPLIVQIDIIQFINDEAGKIDILIAKAEQFIGLLREHRTALIAAAVTGKIDVRGMVDGLEMGDEA